MKDLCVMTKVWFSFDGQMKTINWLFCSVFNPLQICWLIEICSIVYLFVVTVPICCHQSYSVLVHLSFIFLFSKQAQNTD